MLEENRRFYPYVSENDQNSIQSLQKLIKICRKEGIRNFKGAGFEFTLDEPRISNYKRKQEPDAVTEAQYTDEQALFWSSAGIPEVH